MPEIISKREYFYAILLLLSLITTAVCSIPATMWLRSNDPRKRHAGSLIILGILSTAVAAISFVKVFHFVWGP